MERRAFLKAGLGAGALSVVGVSGCVGVPRAEDTRFRWLVEPAELGDELDHYQAFATHPANLAEHRDDLPEETWQGYQPFLDWQTADPEPEEVDRLILLRNGGIEVDIAEHDLDTGELSTTLEATGYESVEAYQGYELYSDPDTESVWALADGIFIAVSLDSGEDSVAGERTALDGVEAVIDAEAGNRRRYHDPQVDTAVRTVLGELETEYNYRVRGTPEVSFDDPESGNFRGSVARGFSSTFDGEDLRINRLEIFTNESDAGDAAENVDPFIESDPIFEGIESADAVERRQDGNLLELHWHIPVAEAGLRPIIGSV